MDRTDVIMRAEAVLAAALRMVTDHTHSPCHPEIDETVREAAVNAAVEFAAEQVWGVVETCDWLGSGRGAREALIVALSAVERARTDLEEGARIWNRASLPTLDPSRARIAA